MRIALFLLLLLALAAALLATQPENMEPVVFSIPYTGLQFSGPKLVVLATTLLVGFVLGYLATLPGRLGAARRARRAEKQLGEVEATRGAAASAEARAAEARAEAHQAHREATAARSASHDAAETQRLADEVARRTSEVRRDAPPPPPER